MKPTPRYLIIGDGKMALHFCHYLTLFDVPFLQWSRSNQPAPLIALLQSGMTVLLLISDSAIQAFVDNNPALRSCRLIHFSGAFCLDGIVGIHPLMTFGKNLYDLETYKSIPFVLEQEGPDWQSLFPDLPNIPRLSTI